MARQLVDRFITSNRLYSGGLVTFLEVDVDGVETGNLIPLYADTSGATQVAQPLTLDAWGLLPQPVYFETAHKVRARVPGLSLDHKTGVFRPPEAGGGGGATTFLGLTDTPDDYAGQTGKLVKVNAGANGLEFMPISDLNIPGPSTGVDTFLELTDTPDTFTGQGLKLVQVNAGGTALDFLPIADLNIPGPGSGNLPAFTAANSRQNLVVDGAGTNLEWARQQSHDLPGRTTVNNANFTTDVATTKQIIEYGTDLTADRTITLSTAGAYDGLHYLILRTGGGSFNLIVAGLWSGGGSSFALVQNESLFVYWVAANSTWRILSFNRIGRPQNFAFNDLVGPNIVTSSKTAAVATPAAGAVTLNAASANVFTTTLSANVTSITITGWPSGYGRLDWFVTQDAVTPRTVTGWPAAVTWPGGGSAPDFSAVDTGARIHIVLERLSADGAYIYATWANAEFDASAIQSALDLKQDLDEKGQANGYAGLDASSLLAASAIPLATSAAKGGISAAIFDKITGIEALATANPNAIETDASGQLDGLTNKATPAGADVLLIEDSAASYAKKKVLISALPIPGASAVQTNVADQFSPLTEKASPVSNDLLILEDSAAAGAKKKVKIGSLPTGTGGLTPQSQRTMTGVSYNAGTAPPVGLNPVEARQNSFDAYSSSVGLLGEPGIIDGQFQVVHGHTTKGDDGGGLFVWDAASTATHDGGIIIKPTATSGAGRWRRVVKDVVNVRWFGAKGDDATDDTAAFQAALATGKSVFVPNPPGNAYQITGQLVVGANSIPQALIGESTFRTLIRWVGALGTPAIYCATQRCRLETFSLWGVAVGYGSTLGSVGVVLGSGALSGDRITVRGLDVRYFTKAGIVLNGLQNAVIVDTNASFCFCNWLITNSTRNNYMFGCISSDWPEQTATTTGKPSFIPQDHWDRAPDVRGVHIGMPSWIEPEVTLNDFTPGTINTEKLPSNIFSLGSIHERGDRHDAIIEIKEAMGLVSFQNVELTRTKVNGSLMLVQDFDNGTDYSSNSVLQISVINPQLLQNNPSAGNPYYLIRNLSKHIIRGCGRDFGFAVVDGPSIMMDNPTRHTLEAHDLFEHKGDWQPQNTTSSDVSSVSKRLRIVLKTIAGSGRCNQVHNPRRGYASFIGRLMKLTVVPTKIANEVNGSGAAFRMAMELPTSPFTKDVMTLAPADVNTEKSVVFPWDSVLGGGMSGALRCASASGLALVTGTAQAGGGSFIRLAATASTTNDHYNGRRVRLTGGTGSGQTAFITDYDGVSRDAFVDTVLSPAPDTTTTYTIEPCIEFAKIELSLLG